MEGTTGIVPVHAWKVWVVVGELYAVGEGGHCGGVHIAVVDAVDAVAVIDVVTIGETTWPLGETTWPLAMRVGLVVITPVGILTRDSIEVTGFVLCEFIE